MAMGREGRRGQEDFWIATQDLARAPGHVFYEKLNSVLARHGFDAFVEERCAQFYAERMGRPSVPPGVYFRMLLVGYFEGIDSERGIAWRCADSLSLRRFLGYPLDKKTPDHSTVSRTRRLLDEETHRDVFTWVLKVLRERGLLDGKTIGVDATTLEANAALRSIVRRDTGEGYEEYLKGLAKAQGIEEPTREDLAKLDRSRPKKGSNEEWRHPHDPDARITKMKDGRTHLAHKLEHGVDMGGCGAIVGVTVQGADLGDTTTLYGTLEETVGQLAAVSEDQELGGEPMAEVVLDKGYHSNQTLVDLESMGIRSYVSEPRRGRRRWKRRKEDFSGERVAVYANRRRVRGTRGKKLLRRRGELLERPFAHCLDTGGMRRVHLRWSSNILKRVLVHVAGFNLALVMRKLLGVGTPRALGDLRPALCALFAVFQFISCCSLRLGRALSDFGGRSAFHLTNRPNSIGAASRSFPGATCLAEATSTTGC
jgi:transposase